MNLHQITTRTLTRVSIIDEQGRCYEDCPGTNYPNDHHDHLRRYWNTGLREVWYCTCACTYNRVEERRDIYVYFLGDEASPEGSATCRDCSNGVHH